MRGWWKERGKVKSGGHCSKEREWEKVNRGGHNKDRVGKGERRGEKGWTLHQRGDGKGESKCEK